MEKLTSQQIGIAVVGVVLLGLAGYQLSVALGGAQTPEVAPVVEAPVVDEAPAPAAAAPTIKAPAKPAGMTTVIETPVATYSRGCTSATGTSTLTGEKCNGSAPLTIVTPTRLPRATSGEPYSVTLETSGGPKALTVYTWSVQAKKNGFPVPGLMLANKYGTSATIKGVPADMYFDGVKTKLPVTFTLEVTATAGTQTDTKTFNLTVNPS